VVGLPTVRIVAARKIEWPRQRRLVPAHTPARALHHAQRHRIRARREGVIGELALARQNFGPGIEERARLDRNPRPRTIDGAIGLSGVRLGRGFSRCAGLATSWKAPVSPGGARFMSEPPSDPDTSVPDPTDYF